MTASVVKADVEWSPIKKIGFRVLCAYLVLFTFPGPIGYIAFAPVWAFSGWLLHAKVALARWTDIHVFGISAPPPFAFTGSGDTLERYTTQFNLVVLAIVAAVIWSLLDRRRADYARLSDWLRAWVRLNLATIIFGYGFAKVIPTQFGFVSLDAYAKPLGEFSPMGLLWAFMASSAPYTIFTGAFEVLGGVLLLFRRTATLGALILIGVLANVAMLNFSYDVPVKIFTLNLMVMAAFIAAPDIRRLADVFLFNRPVAPRPMPPLFARRRWNYAAAAAGALLVGYIVWSDVAGDLSNVREFAAARSASPIYGIYEVEDFRRNDVDVASVVSEPTRWRRVVFDAFNRVSIRRMSDAVNRYSAKFDAGANSVTLSSRPAGESPLTLNVERPDADHLVLRGRLGSDDIVARLRRVDDTQYLLRSRGFNWIQETPFNR